MEAVRDGNRDEVRNLVEDGFSVTEKDVKGYTLFHIACSLNDISNVACSILSILVGKLETILGDQAAAAFLNCRSENKYGVTALQRACRLSSAHSIALLLEHGASVTLTDNLGANCFHYFCGRSRWYAATATAHRDAVRRTMHLLALANADYNARDALGLSPLHIAVLNKDDVNLAIVHTLLEIPDAVAEISDLELPEVDLDPVNYCGNTPLLSLCAYSDVQQGLTPREVGVIRLLLWYGCDADSVNSDGHNAVYYLNRTSRAQFTALVQSCAAAKTMCLFIAGYLPEIDEEADAVSAVVDYSEADYRMAEVFQDEDIRRTIVMYL